MEVTVTETELLCAYRRDLHMIPELDVDLPKTLAYVRARLEELGSGCEVIEPCRSTLCARFAHGKAHATAIRTDMDALPVNERTKAHYASRHPGKMHACGHDGHMAMALVLCRWLAEHAHELPRDVLVVFQPAEETSGGAKRVCESGVFPQTGADRIFGFHLWPDIPKGVVATRPGPLLASSNEVDVTFAGKGVHIARWQEGHDALLAATRFVGDAYASMDGLASDEGVLLRFGTMRAGTVRNAIASEAEVHGSLRTMSVRDRDAAMRALAEAADQEARQTGCTATTHFSEGNPPVVNDRTLFEVARESLPELVIMEQPLLIAEDFAWYQQQLPGLFMLLGTGTGIPLHADTFNFDEGILQVGLDAYKRLLMVA